MVSDEVQKAQSIVGTSPGRPALDFYRTPEEAVIALLKVEDFEGVIWEPACGDGAISKVLADYGNYVVSSDIHDYGFGTVVDFLNTNEIVDHIVTNPPFKHAQAFVEHALSSTNGKVVMLLKLSFLEGQKRASFFLRTPLKNVWVFSKRLQLHRNGEAEAYKNGGMIAFAWFVWEHGYEGRPQIGWI
jgi:hypothetical protein